MSQRRRTFLGAAGASALASFWPALRARPAHAADAIPKRIVFFAGGHGSLADHHWPVALPGKPAPTETEWALVDAHKPLEPWKSKLIYTKGLSMVSAVRDTGKDDPHLVGRGHMLVGRPLAGKGIANGGGISLDQHIAKAINSPMPVTKVASLELGIRFRRAFLPASFSFTAPKQTLPAEWDPKKVFARLFSATSATPAAAPDDAKSVLGFVMDEYRAVAPTLEKADRDKLESHLAAVSDLERRLSVGGGAMGSACTPARIDDLALTHVDGVEMWKANFEAMTRITAAAFACDLTRVVSISLADSGDGGDTDAVYGTYKAGDFGTMSFHDLVHKVAMPGSSQARNPAAVNVVRSAHRLHAEKLARVLEALAAVPERDGKTVLDHTVVLWLSDIGQGNHNYDNLPWVLAGSCGGAFKTGRFLRFPDNTPHNNLLAALATGMGVPTDTFGDPALSKTPLAALRG